LLSAQLWDLKTNKIRVDLPGHTDEVYCVDLCVPYWLTR